MYKNKRSVAWNLLLETHKSEFRASCEFFGHSMSEILMGCLR